MFPIKNITYIIVIVICFNLILCDAATKNIKSKKLLNKRNKQILQQQQQQSKQLFLEPETRETDPPNFVRLVVMRLIYGIATQMGFEDRIAGLFNGAFVPPNADDDDVDGGLLNGLFGDGGGGGGDDDDGGFFDF